MFNELLLENGRIFYREEHDGGGSIFGINSLKDKRVLNNIKKGNILEMCSGPGFMGFYLNFLGYCDYLILSDINNDHNEAISETIRYNELTNTKFIQSDSFKSFYIHNTFDTIVINPPHYSSERNGGYISKEEELICMDKDLKFQKDFFRAARNYLKKDGVIVLIGNMGGIQPEETLEIAKDEFEGEIIACERYGWIRDSKFYVLKLKLKD